MTTTLSAYLEHDESNDVESIESAISECLRCLREALEECIPDEWSELVAELSRSDSIETQTVKVTSHDYDSEYGWYYEDMYDAIDALIDGIRTFLESIESYVVQVEMDITIRTMPEVILDDEGVSITVT